MQDVHFGQRIKLLAKQRSISVSKIAEHVGMTPGGVYDVFKRRSISDTSLLDRICQVLGITIEDILDSKQVNSASSFTYGYVNSLLNQLDEIIEQNDFLRAQIKEKDEIIWALLSQFFKENIREKKELQSLYFSGSQDVA